MKRVISVVLVMLVAVNLRVAKETAFNGAKMADAGCVHLTREASQPKQTYLSAPKSGR